MSTSKQKDITMVLKAYLYFKASLITNVILLRILSYNETNPSEIENIKVRVFNVFVLES